MSAPDIVEHQFTADKQPVRNGRKKGIPNRATVYAKILKMKTKIKNPDGTDQEVTLYEAIALGQAKSAMKGNTNAWKEIQDSIHGKIADKTELTGKDGGPLETTSTLIIQGVQGNDGISD